MILDRIVRGFLDRRAEDNSLGTGTLNDPGWVSRILAATGGVSSSGQAVTEWTADAVPALYACQRAISETLAMLPLKLMRLDGDDRSEARTESLWRVLHDQANLEMTAFTFKELLTRHLTGWGNAYGEVVRDRGGNVIALWPLPPWRTSVDRDEQNRKRWTYTAPNGQRFQWTHDPARSPILHLQINSTDGFVGRSPIRVLMDAVGLTQAVSQFGADWFANYSSPAMAIKHKGKLGKDGRQHLREEWEKLRGTWGNKHRVAVLQEDMSVERLSCPPDEAQFIETRGLQIEEMARIYRVPLFVIQHMTKSTSWGSGIEQMLNFWLSTGLQPFLVNWSQAIARDCLSLRSLHFEAVWIVQALLRMDTLQSVQALKMQIEAGLLSPNEARKLLDRNRRTDRFGDDYVIPMANTEPSTLAAPAGDAA